VNGACTCVELTDGPIPLVVPGIRDAINIITFDYTEVKRKRKKGRLSILVFQVTASARTRLHAEIAHGHVCTLKHSTFVSSTRSFVYFTARIKNIVSKKASTT